MALKLKFFKKYSEADDRKAGSLIMILKFNFLMIFKHRINDLLKDPLDKIDMGGNFEV